MILMAVDTSCDESCVAILDVDTLTLRADIVHSHTEKMLKWGGIVPEIASREHLKALPLAMDEALASANLKLEQIDWFCVTNRPGLIGALLVGVTFTKTLAYALHRPFTALNHIEAHLFSPLLANTTRSHFAPPFPWIALVVSGGHTELFHVRELGDYTWLGGTVDDAAGEAFDKVGKLLSLPYPQGPKIDKWVRESATPQHLRYKFPRADLSPFSFSYSGLKTAVSLAIKKETLLSKVSETSEVSAASEASDFFNDTRLAIAASAQEAILDPLAEQVRLAATKLGVKQIVVTGGVACNSRLRAKLPEAYFPVPKHCTDNAAMVAILGGFLAREGKLTASDWTTTAVPNLV